jgi:formate dehydrogenase major subunit
VTLLAEGSWPQGSAIEDGYPEFTMAVLQQLGWDTDLTPEEMAVIERIGGGDPERIAAVSWTTDLSGGIQRVAIEHGCVPFGNGKARAVAWNLPDPIPVHREPIYSPKPDLVAEYPTRDDAREFRVPNIGARSSSARSTAARAAVPDHPDLGTARGIRGRRRGDALEPLAGRAQQDMFVEINPGTHSPAASPTAAGSG